MKNWWSENLWTVICHIVDDIPTYKVRSSKTGQMKILHQVRLLLWLADFDDEEGLEVNAIRLKDSTSPGTMLETPSPTDAECGVPPGFHYRLNLAKFGCSSESLTSMMDLDIQEVPMGASQNESSLESPMTTVPTLN